MFGAGWTMFVFIFVVIWSEVLQINFDMLNMLGQLALPMYFLREFSFATIERVVPKDSPAWILCFTIPVSLAMNLSMAYYMRRHKINVTL